MKEAKKKLESTKQFEIPSMGGGGLLSRVQSKFDEESKEEADNRLTEDLLAEGDDDNFGGFDLGPAAPMSMKKTTSMIGEGQPKSSLAAPSALGLQKTKSFMPGSSSSFSAPKKPEVKEEKKQ
mmetsp:Transcript_417/g.388  ORF Transcript_417/g.388 Transcript_417/m.388 type:complete len:123 (+) Transcript_417:2804-3172(+)